ncbi:zinc transporter 2-like [Dreissena polymorpha]|nr:zinc transporter 2-like [Dreissena polymorpha]
MSRDHNKMANSYSSVHPQRQFLNEKNPDIDTYGLIGVIDDNFYGQPAADIYSDKQLRTGEFEIGGVKCDDEDGGLSEFDAVSVITKNKHVAPRLVFLGSDEHLNSSNYGYAADSDYSDRNRTLSDNTRVPDLLKSQNGGAPVSRTVRTHSRNSHTSHVSSDSDLLAELDEHFAENEMNRIQLLSSNLEVGEDASSDNGWHCHDGTIKNPLDKTARNQLIAVSILCILFMIGETIGGILSNSLALFTDVLHLGSDLFSFLISLFAMYWARKPATKNMSFGYHRAEVLGALVSVFFIWSVTGVLVYVAVERIQHKHYMDVKANEMLITAVLGVIFNVVMGVVLHSEICCKSRGGHSGFGHGHSHGGSHSHHSHGHAHSENSSTGYLPLAEESDPCLGSQDEEIAIETEPEPKKSHPKNINVRAAFIHVIGDIIQSLGVLLAAIIIKLKPEDQYKLADPICTFLFSILVLLTTVNVLRDTVRIIMEGVPRDTNYFDIKTNLYKIKDVKAVHGLTVWCLTLEKNALAVHLSVDPASDHQRVLSEATDMLHKRYSFLHTTIQVEDHNPKLVAKCKDCTELKK